MERRWPPDLALRALRIFLSVWLIAGPFLVGFAWTFPQKQDAVIGIMLLPLVALGALVPGTRVALIVAGAWLVLVPTVAPGNYVFAPENAIWHDRIVGLACLFLGFLPLPAEAPAETVDRRVDQPVGQPATSHMTQSAIPPSRQ